MRTILFRGKVIEDCSGIDNALKGQWHYGGYFYNEDDDLHFIRRADGHLCQVDPETVGQFTGLYDKHKEVQIFEGDVVNSKSHIPSEYQIEFIEGGFCGTEWPKNEKSPSFYPVDINRFYPSSGTDLIVTGNIHDTK